MKRGDPGVPAQGRKLWPDGIVADAGAWISTFAVAHARVLLCLVAIVPFVPGTWQIFQEGIPDVLFTGDAATLEIRTLHAAHGQQQLGPYSRFLWSHPGPAFFYLALPLYKAFHQRGAALNVFVFVASMSSAVATVLCARKLRGDVFALAVATLLGVYEIVGVPFAMSSEWNPSVPLLPLTLLFFLGASLALGGTSAALPAFVFVGSAIVQTHVGYLPEVLLISAVALLWSVGRWLLPGEAPTLKRRQRTGWALLVAGGVLAVCWVLPVLETVTTHPGNLTDLFVFFTTPHRSQHTWNFSVAEVFRHMAVMPLSVARVFHLAEGEPRWVTVRALAHLQIFGITAALFTGIRRRDGGLAVLAVLALGEVLVAIAAVHAIRGEIFPYLVTWTSTLGFVSTTVAAACLVRGLLGSPNADRAIRVLAIAELIYLGVAVGGAFGHVQIFRERDIGVEKLARDVGSRLLSERIQRPVVRIMSPDTWPTAMGVILHLYKESIPVSVEKSWLYMVGTRFSPQANPRFWLKFGDKAFHEAVRARPDHTLVAASENVYVYAEDTNYLHDHAVVLNPVSVSSYGVVGDAVRAVDAVIPEGGARWDSPLSVVLTSESSALDVKVPSGDLVGLYLSADGNDLYSVRCVGSDGFSWQLGAARPEERQTGMRTHILFTDSLSSCLAIEVRPISGDGAYSIGELGFLRR